MDKLACQSSIKIIISNGRARKGKSEEKVTCKLVHFPGNLSILAGIRHFIIHQNPSIYED